MSNYNNSLQSNNASLQTLISKINALPEATEQQAPSISVNASGLITATAGTKSSTYQLSFQPTKTITPNTANQIAVSGGYYTGGNITVKGDSNLVAGNIKSGVSIFGVNGTYEGSGGSSGNANIEDSLITRELISYSNSTVTSISNYAFKCCNTITSVNFQVCTNIGSYAFESCAKLATANFPACKNISWSAFGLCSKLTTVSFPVCQSIGRNAFYSCSSLTTVSFPACIDISRSAFYYCTSLNTIYLMASSVCTLAESYVFSRTGITSGKGSIYVPSSLVASYKTATNWTYFSNRIFGV